MSAVPTPPRGKLAWTAFFPVLRTTPECQTTEKKYKKDENNEKELWLLRAQNRDLSSSKENWSENNYQTYIKAKFMALKE